MIDTGWFDADGDDEAMPGAALAVDDARVERDLVVPAAASGLRLDQALAGLLPEFSRSRIQGWIDAGAVRLDARPAKPRTRVFGGEAVQVRARLPETTAFAAEPMALAVVHEDADLLVIDKPAGLVVHPAAGNWSGTLLNGLLHRDPALASLPRCGIVHRLDKDTSGLLVVARTLAAHQSLVAQLAARTVRREYRALVLGEVTAGGHVDAPIGRHPVRRTAMAVVASGRPAHSDYRVLARYPGLTLLGVRLHTGRTHQIRVHMAHIGHPLVGDPLYGSGRAKRSGTGAAGGSAAAAVQGFPRQALHALKLGLVHPRTGAALAYEVPLPADFAALLAELEAAACASR
jgi:23S rRNA pseudouridine1911/1915/1917 synthase